jgi:hypothetical protein
VRRRSRAGATIFCREISIRFDLRVKRWVLLAIVPE